MNKLSIVYWSAQIRAVNYGVNIYIYIQEWKNTTFWNKTDEMNWEVSALHNIGLSLIQGLDHNPWFNGILLSTDAKDSLLWQRWEESGTLEIERPVVIWAKQNDR